MDEQYFFDTCILIQIALDNRPFNKYKGISILLTDLNIMELIHFLINDGREEDIDEVIDELKENVTSYDYKTIIEAAKMKFKYKNEKLSFTDCIGYLLAKKNNCKFLTCDGKFENKENVEFIKK